MAHTDADLVAAPPPPDEATLRTMRQLRSNASVEPAAALLLLRGASPRFEMASRGATAAAAAAWRRDTPPTSATRRRVALTASASLRGLATAAYRASLAVSCLVCTVTFHANHAHILTRSP
jgi:hypothetical protein